MYINIYVCIYIHIYIYNDKMIIIAIQDKFALTKFSLHIKFHKELSIMFLEESIVLKTYDSASTMVSIPRFDNDFETI